MTCRIFIHDRFVSVDGIYDFEYFFSSKESVFFTHENKFLGVESGKFYLSENLVGFDYYGYSFRRGSWRLVHIEDDKYDWTIEFHPKNQKCFLCKISESLLNLDSRFVYFQNFDDQLLSLPIIYSEGCEYLIKDMISKKNNFFNFEFSNLCDFLEDFYQHGYFDHPESLFILFENSCSNLMKIKFLIFTHQYHLFQPFIDPMNSNWMKIAILADIFEILLNNHELIDYTTYRNSIYIYENFPSCRKQIRRILNLIC